jgi:hypothetical protein
MPAFGSGGGYDGPLAYGMGKPMRPDVAAAFDRMAAAGRELSPQLTAFFTSATILASSAAVNSFSAKASATWRLRRGSPRR